MFESYIHKIRGFFSKDQHWKKEWQQKLADILEKIQKSLPINIVVVVARESHSYNFIFLYIFGASLCLTLLLSSVFFAFNTSTLSNLMALNFVISLILFLFYKKFFLHKNSKVTTPIITQRAKASFYDYFQYAKGNLLFLYISENEKDSLLLSSPDISHRIPSHQVEKILSTINCDYQQKKPLGVLEKALFQFEEVLRPQFKDFQTEGSSEKLLDVHQTHNITASDQAAVNPVFMLKGSKDIN